MPETNCARHGQVIALKPECYSEYVEHHKNAWPGVLQTIRSCGIRNYSFFFKDNTLFAYFEYIGDNFQADMAKMAADPVTQKWWAIMGPMQQPVPTRAEGEWWAEMNEVFHVD